MALQPGSEYFDLSDYVGVLRRRWTLILAFTLIGLVLGGAYYYITPKKYAATVLVQVNALPSNANQLGGRTGGPVNMDNEAQIVVSAKVVSIVRAKLKSPLGVTGLAKQLHVAVPPNTTYLQITCTTGSADLAAKCANAFGKAYLYNRRASSLALISSEINGLAAEVKQLENSIGKLKAQTGKGGLPQSSHAWGVAKLNLTAEVAKLGSIENKITAVTPFATSLAVANSPLVGQIVTPAIVPFAPISPKKKLYLPSGLAAGLVIGLAAAFLLDWRRPRLYTAKDIQRKVDLPTVFSLTDAKTGTLSAFAPPRSRTGQVFTELAQYVGAALGDGHHVVMVTASAADSGGTVAANLAAALARTRGDTVLICADPRGVMIPRLVGASDGRGFAELLAGTASLADVCRETADVPHLEVITPGLDAAGAVYDMQYDNVQRIMRDLRREVRYVVIDVPSAGVDADTFSVAEFADAAILTLYTGSARATDINDCLLRLERLRTAVLAAVLLPSGKAGRSGRRSAEPAAEPYVHVPPVREPGVREPQVREPHFRERPARVSYADAAEPPAQTPYAYSASGQAPPPQAQTRQPETRHPDVRYAEPLYNDPIYGDPRPSDPRHPEPRPSDPRPSDPRPSETRPSETRPSETRHPESRPPESRPSENRPPESRPPESRPSESRPLEARPTEAALQPPPQPRPPAARPTETRRPETRQSESRPADARPQPSFKPHPRTPQVKPVTRDDASAPSKTAVSQPVLRPVAGRRAPAPGGTNGGSSSRHATPHQAEESEQQESPGFRGAWRPGNVSETWPLPATGLPDEDEESGLSDPPSGDLYGGHY